MLRSLRILFAVAAAVVLLASFSHGYAQMPSVKMPGARIASKIVDSDVVTLMGNVHPQARPELDRGVIAAETRLDRMVLVLSPSAEQQKELDALVEAQYDPKSPEYHHWLTPAEYGSRFGASAADVAQISSWLAGHGFAVEEVPAGRGLIVFSGTAGQVADTFHTEIHRYEAAGAMHIANAQDPQIPRALAPVVAGVLSLHDFRRTSALHLTRPVVSPEVKSGGSRPEYSQGTTHYMTPEDYGTIFDLSPLYAAGTNGAGTTIAIVGRSNINLSDVSAFRSFAGLPANQPTVILDGTNPGVVTGPDQDEATLDVEWSGAVAPSATVKFVVAATTSTTDGVDLSAAYIVNNQIAKVMSTSFGSCEAGMGTTELAFYNNLWQQAASEGISSFVSSGDAGVAGCNVGGDSSATVKGVNGLCSSPYSTCVGGTEFNEGSGNYWSTTNDANNGSALGYIPEKVWNESSLDGGTGLWSSGGGISQTYEQPAWQQGVSGANSNGMRAVPDVSMPAATHDGYMINENGSFFIAGGTSAASPSFAGIMALVEQSQGGAGQGNVNPTLYGLLNGNSNVFHATPTGNNSVSGEAGYTATGTTYNLATGLGSVDGNLLIGAWGSGSGTVGTSGFTLTSSLASLSVLKGQKATLTITVKAAGGFNGTVALSATAPSGVTVAFSSASVAAGASATATVTVSSTATVGVGNVVITGTSGSVTSTASVQLAVTTPTVTVQPGVASISVLQGQSATFPVTVTASAGLSGTVTLSATAPTGVTVSFSPEAVSPGSSATATVTVSSTAASGSGSIAITGSGGSVTGMASVALTIGAPVVTLQAAPASISVLQGQSTTFAVTAAATSGYTTPVVLSATAPSGVNVIFTPSSITPGQSSTATVTATGTAAAGVGSIVITGASGLVKATATESLTVVAPTVTIQTGVTSVSVLQGQTTTFPVSISAPSGFTGSVTLSAKGPAGVTVSFSSASIKPGQGVTATVAASSTAAAGTGTITVTGTTGSVTSTANVGVTVVAPAVTLNAGAASLTLLQGQTTTFPLTVTASSGYTTPVALSATGPAGVSIKFSSTSVSPGSSTTVTVTASGTAAAGAGTITVTGTSGSITSTANVGVTVGAPAVKLTLGVASVSVLQGLTTTFPVAVSAPSGYTKPVTLSAKGPAGVTVTFSSSSLTSGQGATATVTASSSAAVGAGTITVTGTSGSVTVTATENVTVIAPVLTLKASAATETVVQGKTATFSVSVTATSGFTNPVTLSATGPAGVSVTFNPQSVTPGSSSTATVRVATSATAGAGTLTINGVSGALTGTTTVGMTVQAPPAIVVAPAASRVSMNSNATQQLTVTAMPQNGAALSTGAGTSFQVEGMPAGVTATWGAAKVTAGGAVQATVTLTGSGAATSGTAQLTFSARVPDASSGTIDSGTAPATLVVTRTSSLNPTVADR